MEFRKPTMENMEINKFWIDRPVLVTGCTGLLGSWLVPELLSRGAIITGIVRDFVPKSIFFLNSIDKQINLVKGDIEDFDLIKRTITEYQIDTVFHLAAQTIVEIGLINPMKTFETNIKGTWNLLEACRTSSSVTRVIVASSDKAYGDQETLPYDESFPLEGKHPYDVSKSCADLISTTYFTTYGVPIAVTRCGNLYGGGDLNFNRLVPETIYCAFRNKKLIIRSDGNYIRDFFYVKDAVLAYITLAEQMDRKEVCGEAFNFSNELQISVIELVNKILELIEKENLEVVISNKAVSEIKHQYLSSSKARDILKWTPHYSLDQSLIETVEWYKKYFSYT